MSTARLLSGQPATRRTPEGRRVLLEPLVVDLGVLEFSLHEFPSVAMSEMGATVITVPAGFDTDFSSIPVALAWVLGDWRKYDLAGVVHDWLYRIGADRLVADRVWRRVARSGDFAVGPVRGFLGWAGLRVGGWVAYRNLRGVEA